MSVFSVLKLGQKYADIWPLEAKLGGIFPENRVIKTTKFAQKFMPFLSVFAIFWQQLYAAQSHSAFAIAVLTAIFALFLPLQGLYWLGKRAKTALPHATKSYFLHICEQLRTMQKAVPSCADNPTYYDLALVLQQAKRHFPASFWQDL